MRRLLTDNGAAFRSKDFAASCKGLGVRHRFTRTYPPQRANDGDGPLELAERLLYQVGPMRAKSDDLCRSWAGRL